MNGLKLTQKLILLAIDMDEVAGDMMALDTEFGKDNATNLEEAAATVRQWAQSLEGV